MRKMLKNFGSSIIEYDPVVEYVKSIQIVIAENGYTVIGDGKAFITKDVQEVLKGVHILLTKEG